MKKLSTLAVAAALVVSGNIAFVEKAEAFSFGNFDMDNNSWGPNRGGNRWGPGGGWGGGPRWGNGNKRWGGGNRWGMDSWDDWGPWGNGPRWGNSGPSWGNGFRGPRFNMGDGDGFGWSSKKGPRFGDGWRSGPRWGNGPGSRWGKGPGPRWGNGPGPANMPPQAPPAPMPEK